MKNIIKILIPLSILIILTVAFIIYISSNTNSKKTEQLSILQLLPAIINSDNVEFHAIEGNDTIMLSKGSQVTIINESNDSFLIEIDNKQGYVDKHKVTYFQFNSNEQYSLVLDVSKFNIINKNLTDYVDFAKFIVDNKINYTYIRLCR